MASVLYHALPCSNGSHFTLSFEDRRDSYGYQIILPSQHSELSWLLSSIWLNHHPCRLLHLTRSLLLEGLLGGSRQRRQHVVGSMVTFVSLIPRDPITLECLANIPLYSIPGHLSRRSDVPFRDQVLEHSLLLWRRWLLRHTCDHLS